MLAYILALTVGFGSFALYMTAFFLPEVHRKYDFIWSGIGLFYALVLWVCAGRITGGVLLGQMASVALLGWFGWQTLTLRRELTPPELQTQVSASSVPWIGTLKNQIEAIQANLQQRFQTGSLPVGLSQLTSVANTVRDFVQGLWSSTFKSKPPRPPIDIPPRPIPTSPPAAPPTPMGLEEEEFEASPGEVAPGDLDEFESAPVESSEVATTVVEDAPGEIPSTLPEAAEAIDSMPSSEVPEDDEVAAIAPPVLSDEDETIATMPASVLSDAPPETEVVAEESKTDAPEPSVSHQAMTEEES